MVHSLQLLVCAIPAEHKHGTSPRQAMLGRVNFCHGTVKAWAQICSRLKWAPRLVSDSISACSANQVSLLVGSREQCRVEAFKHRGVEMGSWFQTLAHASDLQSLNDLWQFALLITCRMIHWRNVKLFHCTLVFACRKTFFLLLSSKSYAALLELTPSVRLCHHCSSFHCFKVAFWPFASLLTCFLFPSTRTCKPPQVIQTLVSHVPF